MKGERSRRAGAGCCQGSGNGIADGHLRPLTRDKVDAEFLVPEGGTQRRRQIKVAAAGFGVDVGGAASAVAPVDPKQPVSDPDIAADPLELLPRFRAIDVEIGP